MLDRVSAIGYSSGGFVVVGRTSDAIVLVSLIPSVVLDDRGGEDVSSKLGAACRFSNGTDLFVSFFVCFFLCINIIKNTITAARKRPPTQPTTSPIIVKLLELIS